MPSILEPDGSSKKHRRNWAGLIRKIYQVDPLTCAKCGGRMKIVSFIEDTETMKKILKNLDWWDLKSKPLPKANAPPDNIEPHRDYSDSQLPPPSRYRARSGEAGGSYDYLYVDEQYPEDSCS